MDKIKADNLIQDVNETIAEVLARFGVELTKTRGKYSDTDLTVTLTFTELAADPTAINTNTQEARHYTMLAATYGLDPELLGKEVEIDGKVFTILGWNTRAPRNPIQMRGADGKLYRGPIGWAARGKAVT